MRPSANPALSGALYRANDPCPDGSFRLSPRARSLRPLLAQSGHPSCERDAVGCLDWHVARDIENQQVRAASTREIFFCHHRRSISFPSSSDSRLRSADAGKRVSRQWRHATFPVALAGGLSEGTNLCPLNPGRIRYRPLLQPPMPLGTSYRTGCGNSPSLESSVALRCKPGTLDKSCNAQPNSAPKASKHPWPRCSSICLTIGGCWSVPASAGHRERLARCRSGLIWNLPPATRSRPAKW
jgi:hypothetical protein